MDDDSWFSDAALRKQRDADDKISRGEPLTLDDMAGMFQPRTQPAPADACAHCHQDARPQVGGELINGWRWCWLCIQRGRVDTRDHHG